MTNFLVGIIACSAIVVFAIMAISLMISGIWMMFSLWSLRITKTILGCMVFLLGFVSFLWISVETISCLGVGVNVRWVQEK